MVRFALTFVAATAACAVIYFVRCRLSGETRFSAPLGVVFVGLPAALAAHVTGTPLAALVVVALYALAAWSELREERKLKAEAARRLSAGTDAGPGRESGGPGAA